MRDENVVSFPNPNKALTEEEIKAALHKMDPNFLEKYKESRKFTQMITEAFPYVSEEYKQFCSITMFGCYEDKESGCVLWEMPGDLPLQIPEPELQVPASNVIDATDPDMWKR